MPKESTHGIPNCVKNDASEPPRSILPSKAENKELLEEIACGDMAAFSTLMKHYSQGVYTLVVRIIGDVILVAGGIIDPDRIQIQVIGTCPCMIKDGVVSRSDLNGVLTILQIRNLDYGNNSSFVENIL